MGCVGTKVSDTDQEINPKEIDISHFKIIRQIGKGGFAEVFVARRRNFHQELVAIKRIPKRTVVRVKKHTDSQGREVERPRLSSTVWAERLLMARTNSPFLVPLLHAFHDEHHLYYVMPLLSGGDLGNFLRTSGVISEAAVKFYIAEIILALEALHSMNVVYHDLKPNNILMRSDGHICLTDFGLCREVPNKANGLHDLHGANGTKGYQAPEMFSGKGHSFPVDFFALGITMYRLLTDSRLFKPGRTVFRGALPVKPNVFCARPREDESLGPAYYRSMYENKQSVESVCVRRVKEGKGTGALGGAGGGGGGGRGGNGGNGKQKGWVFEQRLSNDAVSIISLLVEINPENRLGSPARTPSTAKTPRTPLSSPLPRTQRAGSLGSINLEDLETPKGRRASGMITPATKSGKGPGSKKNIRSPPPIGLSGLNEAKTTQEDEDEGDSNDSELLESEGQDIDDIERLTKYHVACENKSINPPAIKASAATPKHANGVGSSPTASGPSTARRGPRSSINHGGNAAGKQPSPRRQSVGSRTKLMVQGRDAEGNWTGLHQGYVQIKNHPFFKDIDWEKLSRLELPPPIIPQVNMACVVQEFPADTLAQGRMGRNVSEKVQETAQLLFKEFSWNVSLERNRVLTDPADYSQADAFPNSYQRWKVGAGWEIPGVHQSGTSPNGTDTTHTTSGNNTTGSHYNGLGSPSSPSTNGRRSPRHVGVHDVDVTVSSSPGHGGASPIPSTPGNANPYTNGNVRRGSLRPPNTHRE